MITAVLFEGPNGKFSFSFSTLAQRAQWITSLGVDTVPA
jgi:hypothetical protein